MTNIITGEIHHIGETVTFPSGFSKRLCVITFQDGDYQNQLALDFLKDKGDQLDRYQVGQTVTISFNLRSNESPKKPGMWFTSANAWKIEGEHQSQAQQPAPSQPAPQSTGQQAPSQGEGDCDSIPF